MGALTVEAFIDFSLFGLNFYKKKISDFACVFPCIVSDDIASEVKSLYKRHYKTSH